MGPVCSHLGPIRLQVGPEFQRLLDKIVTPDVYEAARTLRNREAFIRDDDTPLNYTLVNIKDWCKNSFEVVNQLRINTDNSHHRYDVILLINGVPAVQIELKTLGISRSMSTKTCNSRRRCALNDPAIIPATADPPARAERAGGMPPPRPCAGPYRIGADTPSENVGGALAPILNSR